MDFIDKDENEDNQHLSIHIAVDKGDITSLLNIIWRDPSLLELQNEQGLTPLASATQNNQLPAMKQLVQMGANINSQDDMGRTPVSIAAYRGWYEGVLFLLRRGAKPYISDKCGRSPLHASTYHQNISILNALLQSLGEDDVNKADKEFMTSLHWAAFHNRPEHLDELIQKGADYFAQDVDGKTPLHWAAQNGCLGCCYKLASYPDGALLINSEDLSGKTPIHFAAAAGYADVIQTLNNFPGCNLEPQDPDNRTPLHWASAMGKLECMKVLINLGVAANPIDSDGGTPLDYTKELGNKECQRLLEQKLGHVSNVNESEVTSKKSSSSNSSTPTKVRRGPLSFIKDLFLTRKTNCDIELTATTSDLIKPSNQNNLNSQNDSSAINDQELPSDIVSRLKDDPRGLQVNSLKNQNLFRGLAVEDQSALKSGKSPDVDLFLTKGIKSDSVEGTVLGRRPLPDIKGSPPPLNKNNSNNSNGNTLDMDERSTTPKSSRKKDKLGPLRGVKPLYGKGLMPHERIMAIKREDITPRSPTPPGDFEDKFSQFSLHGIKSRERRHTLHTVDSQGLLEQNDIRNCVSSCEESKYPTSAVGPRPTSRPRQVLNNAEYSSSEDLSIVDDDETKESGLSLPERKLLDRKIHSVLY